MANAAVQTNPVGRPSTVTPETIAYLEDGARVGLMGLELCKYSGLSKSVYYDYLKANPKLSDRLEVLRVSPVIKARQRLEKDITSDNPWIATNAAKYIIDKVDGKARQTMHLQDDLTITVQRKSYDAIDAPEPCEVIDVVSEDEE